MIDSLKIEEYIKKSSNIFISAHKNIDLDAIGSILGMYYVCKKFNKDIYIIIDDKILTPEMERAITSIKELGIIPVNYKESKKYILDKTLLIITDTNKSSRLQNIKLNNIKNKIVIDHHIETSDFILDPLYKCIDVKSSSACEMVLSLIKKMEIEIPSIIATIMLAGIYIDTNGFLLKTTKNTHKYTALLYEYGADNIEAEYLLKQNFREFKRRQKLTLNTEFYNNIAIATSKYKYTSIELAKASDVILTFNNVEASFSIAKLDDNIIGISARSLGNIDVEIIMNHFGGGGHKTDAACQIKSNSVSKVKEELLEFIGGLNEGNIS